MTFSYDPSLADAVSQVRSRVGDIISVRALFPDETYTAVLATVGGDNAVIRAAIAMIDRILARVARDVDRSAMGMTGTLDEVTQHYRALRVDLQRELALGAVPFFGGQSKGANNALDADSDARLPPFKIGQFDMGGGDDSR